MEASKRQQVQMMEDLGLGPKEIITSSFLWCMISSNTLKLIPEGEFGETPPHQPPAKRHNIITQGSTG